MLGLYCRRLVLSLGLKQLCLSLNLILFMLFLRWCRFFGLEVFLHALRLTL